MPIKAWWWLLVLGLGVLSALYGVLQAIFRELGVGRNTVRRALASDVPPSYPRPGEAADRGWWVELQIWTLLAE